jgi:hypothetical protein
MFFAKLFLHGKVVNKLVDVPCLFKQWGASLQYNWLLLFFLKKKCIPFCCHFWLVNCLLLYNENVYCSFLYLSYVCGAF